jgi:hypothetical protein
LSRPLPAVVQPRRHPAGRVALRSPVLAPSRTPSVR